MKSLRVFIGYDPRQPVAYNVCAHSVQRHASVPVSVTMLKLDTLPITRRGLTDFTYSRYLVPWLCDYDGPAVFMDSDIVVKGDIAELFAQSDGSSVQVNKKQESFEWPSVMLFNSGACKTLTPEYVDSLDSKLFKMDWGTVGEFSPEWNHCVGYAKSTEAKLYHYTQGVPVWFQTKGLPEDSHWDDEVKALNHTVTWKELMQKSVHARPTLERLFKELTT